MKDLVINGKRVRCEIRILASCLLLALLTNVCAIIAYQTHWSELVTTWRVMLGLMLGFYGWFALLRLAWAGLKRLIRC